MKYNLALILVLTGLLSGCAGTAIFERNTSARNIVDYTQPEQYTLVYSLPKTTVRVSIDAVQTITRRGPYYQYAERYLGIPGVPESDEISWQIGNINIETYEEADPEHYYLLKTNDRHVTNFFKLQKEGFILPVNQRQLPELEGVINPTAAEIADPLFTDLSIHPRVVEESRTVMRMVRQDTAFVNVPVMERQSVTKSLEARAAEVADLIFELRSSRFRLISGDLDLFPDGKAMEEIIREYSRLENEYLNLFTGKVFEVNHKFSVDYTPGKNPAESGIEHAVVFRFSGSQGILPSDDVSGRPVTLELNNENKTARLQRITEGSASALNDQGTLLYRIPDVAVLKITDENSTIAVKRIPVSQYGKVVTLPADFLWNP